MGNRLSLYFFFFQAEDGIRDRTVTGLQTCALPIYRRVAHAYDRWIRLQIERDQFVRLADPDRFENSGQTFETNRIDRALIAGYPDGSPRRAWQDRKSTRLNSSHRTISYAVFCLKKK